MGVSNVTCWTKSSGEVGPAHTCPPPRGTMRRGCHLGQGASGPGWRVWGHRSASVQATVWAKGREPLLSAALGKAAGPFPGSSNICCLSSTQSNETSCPPVSLVPLSKASAFQLPWETENRSLQERPRLTPQETGSSRVAAWPNQGLLGAVSRFCIRARPRGVTTPDRPPAWGNQPPEGIRWPSCALASVPPAPRLP